MNEDFLHYIWKFGLFDKNKLTSTKGDVIEIIKQGEHNKDSGPDFFNAQIKINGTLWAGNVEIHINSGDWLKHKHQEDKAYTNVILHVVLIDDAEIKNYTNELIPALELKYRIFPTIKHNYEQLKKSTKKLPCASSLIDVKEFTVSAWLERMAIERLEEKTLALQKIYTEINKDWQETFYRLLAKNFGFKTNSEAFYLLAKKLPFNLLLNYKNNLFQLESLLFGTAGFLNQAFNDAYPKKLQNEFEFLRKKHSIVPLKEESWKFMRMRPFNFPSLRIAQFAMLVHHSAHLFSKIVEEKKLSAIQLMFKHNCSEYWDTHYSFSSVSENKKKNIGTNAVNTLLINTVVPLLFFYGKTKNEHHYISRAVDFLMEIKAENNSITKEFTIHKLPVKNACDTQGLLNLEKNYCKKHLCLDCAIGNEILRKQ